MKKLGKRLVGIQETIEAYACGCSSCSCSLGCGCECSFILGAPTNDSGNRSYESAYQYDYIRDDYSSNYSK